MNETGRSTPRLKSSKAFKNGSRQIIDEQTLEFRRQETGLQKADETTAAATLLSKGSGLIIALMSLYYLASLALMIFNRLLGVAALAAGVLLFFQPLYRLFRKFLWKQWEMINVEWLAAGSVKRKFDYRPPVVMVTAAAALTFIEYGGGTEVFRVITKNYWPGVGDGAYYDLAGYAYWSLCRFVGYVVIPLVVVSFMPGERLKDYGLSFKGVSRHAWIYGVLLLIVLPAIVTVSFTAPFQHKYPFYKLAARSWTDFFAWEFIYGVQFLSLEIFFRGFMLHGMKRVLGAYSIFAMVVPYCMIHFSKPWVETYGAIAAGIALGTLSLRTRSIWCGVLIHLSVAFSMDILALIQTVGLPGHASFGF
jgi:uncharacterized protein